ncbi:outer membrane beta-barrel protein [bacterium]|nr:outer membrane beta-barrel protein [bacterium]MBU1920552.1 outer membrane beta-barrel protein [bacterium]
MKKVIPLLIISLLLVGQAYSKPAFGLRLGLNSANATHGPDENDYQSDSKAGLILGGAFEAAISKNGNRTIRIEASYVQKGWQDSGELFGVGISGKADIDEFVFTPAVIFRLSDAKTIPYILVGADVGFTMKAKATVDVGGLEGTADIPDWEGTDAGLDLGVGLLFPSGEGEFLTELRFSIGMTDMYPGDDWDPTTNNVEFILGYNFTVPK